MAYIKHIISMLLWVTPFTCIAQQVPVLSTTSVNSILYNPSMAGKENLLRATLQYRQQWTGMPGAPETMVMSLDGNMNEKMGLGLVVYNDASGIFGQTACLGNYSYELLFGTSHKLRLGLGLGVIQNRIDYSKITAEVPDEESILGYADKGSKFDAGFGLQYAFKNFYLDFSAMHLLNNHYIYEDQSNFKQTTSNLISHFLLAAGYSYPIRNTSLSLQPWVAIRSALGMTVQYEGNLTINWKQLVSLTGGYRQEAGVYSCVNFKVFNTVSIGYAYDFPNRYTNSVTRGSNEIIVSFLLPGKRSRGDAQPSSGDIKTLKKQSQVQYQEIEKLQLENSRLVKQVASAENKISDQKQELEQLKDIFNKDKKEVQKIKEKYEVDLSQIDSLKQNDSIDHKKEFYVIVGAYLTIADAKFFQKILERELGLQTLVFEREDNKYFFVYSRKVSSKEEATREFKRLKKMNLTEYINGNIWVYGEK